MADALDLTQYDMIVVVLCGLRLKSQHVELGSPEETGARKHIMSFDDLQKSRTLGATLPFAVGDQKPQRVVLIR